MLEVNAVMIRDDFIPVDRTLEIQRQRLEASAESFADETGNLFGTMPFGYHSLAIHRDGFDSRYGRASTELVEADGLIHAECGQREKHGDSERDPRGDGMVA